MSPGVIVICGPTASGKTTVSVEVAKALKTDIISADSMQIYKDVPIGTAQPTQAEMQGITHHMMGIVDPSVNYHVGEYQRNTREHIHQLHKHGKDAVLCGGTGLYIDAAIYNLDFSGATVNQELRDALWAQYETDGADAVYQRLVALDATAASRIHPNNVKRVIRAIEVIQTTGKPIPAYNNEIMKTPVYPRTIMMALMPDRDYLYERINERVDIMIESGLIDETRSLVSRLGYDSGCTVMKALGYKELIPYLRGQSSLAECVTLLKRDTRHFAKRQISWYRRYDDLHWIEYGRESNVNEIVTKVFKLLKQFHFQCDGQ